jgi:hypothetical protein
MSQRKSKQSKKQSSKTRTRRTNVVMSRPRGAPMNRSRRVANSRGTSRRIKHSELFFSGAIPAQTMLQFPLNPGLAEFFPWMAPQANQYDQYRIHSITFRYIARVPTINSGVLVMAMDYNAYNGPPTTVRELTSYHGAVSDSIWRDLTLRGDVGAIRATGPRKYTRSGPIGGDFLNYDIGTLLVTTDNENGYQYNIWCDLDVEFFMPQLNIQTIRTPGVLSYASDIQQNVLAFTNSNIIFDDVVTNDAGAVPEQTDNGWLFPAGAWLINMMVPWANLQNFATIFEMGMSQDGTQATSRVTFQSDNADEEKGTANFEIIRNFVAPALVRFFCNNQGQAALNLLAGRSFRARNIGA